MNHKHRMILYSFVLLFSFAFMLPYNNSNIDPAFQETYNDFIKIVKENCKEDQYFHPDFQIEFHEFSQDDPNVGMCMYRPNRFMIWIDRAYWNKRNSDAQYSLLMHELGHCMLKLDDQYLDPNDIMYKSDKIINSKEIVREQMTQYAKKVCK